VVKHALKPTLVCVSAFAVDITPNVTQLGRPIVNHATKKVDGDNRSQLTFWKWMLIVSSLLVIAANIAVHVKPNIDNYPGASMVGAILFGAALVFLFFGSPFLVRSHRWLAIVGWCTAAASILFSAL
jgi:hypothetical protein